MIIIIIIINIIIAIPIAEAIDASGGGVFLAGEGAVFLKVLGAWVRGYGHGVQAGVAEMETAGVGCEGRVLR